MEDFVREDLNKEEQSDFHKKILERARGLVKMSRGQMECYYKKWDRYDDIYRGYMEPDDKDKKAEERKEPTKMVVPLTYAQIQTYVAFCLLMYTQRDNVYELNGTGVEDWKAAKIGEALLRRDLNKNNFLAVLYQFLLDISRFGVGIIKHTWVHETQKEPVTRDLPLYSPSRLVGKRQETVIESKTKFKGNRIFSISPYRFYPDVRLPITRFQEGEFCASEDEVPRTELLRQQHEGLYAGIKYIKDFSREQWDSRKNTRAQFSAFVDTEMGASSDKQTGRAILVTEVQLKLVPSEFEVNGKPLGPEDYPIKYVVVYANDQRVIKCEPLGYLHDEFTYDVSTMSPDQHRFINAGLAETIDELQNVVSWLINSHITAIRKTVQNILIVDPDGVNMDDLQNRAPVIRLKKGVSKSGIDRWIKQLQISDVTQGNIRDATSLGELIQLITGINDNALGQYSKGRRSAEQTKAVNAGASGRLKMSAMLHWTNAIEPLGRKLLSNLRDGLDEETFVKVLGLQTTNPINPYQVSMKDMGSFIGVTKDDLVGNYDFEMLEGTLPSDKSAIASMLQDLLSGLMANPEAAAVLGLNPQSMMQEIGELRGIRNPERFAAAQTLPPGGTAAMQTPANITPMEGAV